MTSQTPKPPLTFYRTGPMPCPYLAGRVERNLFTELNGTQAQRLHDQLAQAGFRRSHHIVYRPACPGCNGCVPVRIPVPEFEMTRSQRRVWNKNADLHVAISIARASEEHYELFTRYQNARHSGGEMATMSFSDFRSMIEDSVVQTELMTIRDSEGRLLGAASQMFSPTAIRRSTAILSQMKSNAASARFACFGFWSVHVPVDLIISISATGSQNAPR